MRIRSVQPFLDRTAAWNVAYYLTPSVLLLAVGTISGTAGEITISNEGTRELRGRAESEFVLSYIGDWPSFEKDIGCRVVVQFQIAHESTSLQDCGVRTIIGA
jgi:hypothetical protein